MSTMTRKQMDQKVYDLQEMLIEAGVECEVDHVDYDHAEYGMAVLFGTYTGEAEDEEIYINFGGSDEDVANGDDPTWQFYALMPLGYGEVREICDVTQMGADTPMSEVRSWALEHLLNSNVPALTGEYIQY